MMLGYRDLERELFVRYSISFIYLTLGHYQKALEFGKQMLAIYSENEYILGECFTQFLIGQVYFALGQKQQAEKHLEQALAIIQSNKGFSSKAKKIHHAEIHHD